jgi:hypothetical protein
MWLAFSSHRNLISPNTFRLGGHKVRDFCGNISGTDAVRPRKPHPFNSQAFAQMAHASFRCIVRCLELRGVHNMPTHARRRDEAAVGEAGKIVLLLLPPDLACCTRTNGNSINVGFHYFVVVRDLPISHGALCPWDTSIGNEDVKSIVEFLCLRGYGFFDGIGVLDIDLVGPACRVRN